MYVIIVFMYSSVHVIFVNRGTNYKDIDTKYIVGDLTLATLLIADVNRNVELSTVFCI